MGGSFTSFLRFDLAGGTWRNSLDPVKGFRKVLISFD
jgi:hypothetical protein